MGQFFTKDSTGRVNRVTSEEVAIEGIENTDDYLNPSNKPILFALAIDGEFIFDDTYNSFYNPPVIEQPNTNYTFNDIEIEINKLLDNKSKEYGYDSIISATSYINSTVAKYKKEAKSLSAWRDALWQWAPEKWNTLFVDPEKIEIPEFNSFFEDMPVFIVP